MTDFLTKLCEPSKEVAELHARWDAIREDMKANDEWEYGE